jgi:type IV secretory pathway TrbD component
LAVLGNALETLRRQSQRLALGRAAAYAIAARAWQFLAGPVTILLIASRFSPELQGWYYTFTSLLAVQQLCELGLPNTLLHVASHSWARLKREPNGSLSGDPAALAELTGIVHGGRRWFAAIVAAFVAITLGPGYFFLASQPTDVAWQGPWVAAVAMASGTLVLSVDFAVLEGCGRVIAIYRQRLAQIIVSSIVVWIGLIAGLQLWVIPLYAAVRLLMEFVFSRILHRRFWASLPHSNGGTALWREVVWPLQWRAAIHGMMTYLAYQLFVPIIFRTDGPVAAGRLGMTWSILTTLQSAAAIWMHTRASDFGVLIRQRQFAQLDSDYGRVARSSLALLAIALTLVVGGTLALTLLAQSLGEPAEGTRDIAWLVARLRDRLLDPANTLLFSLGVLAMHLPQCQTIYLRSHLRDPLLRPAFVLNLLMCILAILGAVQAGVTGLAIAYATVSIVGYLPIWYFLWSHYRAEWHGQSTNIDSPPSS